MIDGVIRLGSSLAFVGRRRELARLEAAFQRVGDGQPTMVLLAGEAGVGKTRLTNEFIGTARAGGATVMIGGCLDVGGGGLPYAPFAEAFRTVDREAGQLTTNAGSGAGATELHAMVASLSGGMSRHADDPLDSQGARARLFDSVLAILARVAAAGPSVLVLEDLHWADGSTRDLIRFLIRNLRAERLLIIGTYRTDELYRDHPFMPLLAELGRAAPVERLDLGRFGPDEVTEQVAGILGAAPTSELIESLVKRSDGLPFYVEELLAVDPLTGRAMPTTLRDILGRHLATLSRPTLELVQVAAAIRGHIDGALLAEVMEAPEASLSPALREAIDRHVLVAADGVTAPTYAFRHALMQAAAYDDLLPDERVRLHARIADAIDARIARSVEVGLADVSDAAAHAFAALDQPRALQRSMQAADACIAAGASREAFEHVNRTLTVWDRVPDAPARAGRARWQTLRLAASLASALGRHDDAVAFAERALLDPGSRVRSDRVDLLADLFVYGWEISSSDVSSAAASQAYAAVVDTPPDRTKALGVKIYGVEQWRQDKMLESATLLEDALGIAAAIGDRRGWTEIASSLVHTYADLGYIGRVTELMDRISTEGSSPDHALRSLVAIVDTIAGSWAAGRYDEAVRVGVTVLDWMSRHNLHIGVRTAVRCFLADTYLEMGRLTDVQRVAEPILEADGVARPYLQWIRQTLAIAATWQGDLTTARSHLAVLEAGRGPAQYYLVAVAEVARAEGRFPSVADAVRASRATAAQDVTGTCAVLQLGIAAAADAAITARQRRRHASEEECATDAAGWLELLEETVEETRVGGGPGPVIAAFEATARAEIERLLGRSNPTSWRTVVEQWSVIGQQYRAAYGRLRLGEAALVHDRDRAIATLELRRARSDAHAIGASGLVTGIDTIARDARLAIVDAETSVRSSEVDGTGPAISTSVALTERERAVLRLVAEGHTNREVGDRLSISDKTVSVHVSNAMAKLQSLSRYEAAAAAQRLGLL